MASIYYNIAEGWHCGSEAVLAHLPNADALNSVDLDALGWAKTTIPDHWGQIFGVKYVDGQLKVRNDPPPYWDDLGRGLVENSLFQRLQPIRFAVKEVDTIMGMISDVVGIGKSQISLAFTLMSLRSILEQIGQPVTSAEIAEAEELLTSCGFEPNFFTYAQNVVSPPPPPIVNP